MRRVHALAPMLAALAAVGTARCGGEGGKRAEAAPAGVVVFCFDTLRADAAARVPSLVAFGKDAVSFPDAVASASWTEPSISTMLTGLLPSRHGVQGVRHTGPLVPAITTLAERLRDAGWDTAAFTGSGFLSAESGLAQGFSRFEPTFDEGPDRAIERWSASRAAGKPFFLFLHTYAAHDPYGDKTGFLAGRVPPDPEALARAKRLVAEAEARGGAFPPEAVGDFMVAYLSDVRKRVAFGDVLQRTRPETLWDEGMTWLDGGYRADPRRADLERTLRSRYEDGLAYVEAIASKAFAALDGGRLPHGTAVLVLADHGEAFGEHEYFGHGRFLHDELVRVPFLLRAPGRARGPRSVAGAAGVVDVTPTVLDLAGLPAPSDLDGRSLLPAAAGTSPPPARAIVAEAMRTLARAEHGRPEVVGRLVSARTPEGKAIVTTEVGSERVVSEEVYDLAADPSESKPLPWEALDRMPDALRAAAARLRPK